MLFEKKSKQVERNTSEIINERIAKETEVRIKYYSLRAKREIDQRIEELENEWDIEKVLMANASALSLTGIILGFLHNKKWFFLPGVVTSFLLQHAMQGWCPPLPLFRKLGIRTRSEIEQEKYALKAVRGDFNIYSKSMDNIEKAEAALEAVNHH